MSSGLIYFIMNIITGECYIGQTWGSLEQRWKQHCKPSSECIYLRNAILKYGKEKFVKSVLTKDLTTQEDMDAAETYWIGYYDSIENGYNLKEGGSHGKHSEKTKVAMSASHMGIQAGENNPMFGKKHTDKTKAKMSASRAGKKRKRFTDEWRAAMSVSHKGKRQSPETVAKRIATRKAKKEAKKILWPSNLIAF